MRQQHTELFQPQPAIRTVSRTTKNGRQAVGSNSKLLIKIRFLWVRAGKMKTTIIKLCSFMYTNLKVYFTFYTFPYL